MRLSTAIRMGSLLVEPVAGSLSRCALGMGMRACGVTPRKMYAHDFDSVGHDDYSTVKGMWPFLQNIVIANGEISSAGGLIAHVFDAEVMQGRMTIDALCDWVATWERELEAQGINVEQVSMMAELTEPASPIQSIEKVIA